MAPLCDLCSEPEPVWFHPALSFPVNIDGVLVSTSLNEWLACETCHRLIEAGDRDALAIRSADRLIMDHPEFVLDTGVLSPIRQVHDQSAAGYSSPVTVAERADTIIRHLSLFIDGSGEPVAVRELKKHIGWYARGFAGASEIRRAANAARSKDDIMALTERIRAVSEADNHAAD